MKKFKVYISALCLLISNAVCAQGISYDETTGLLMIPSVAVGSENYVDVTLLNIGPGYTFSLKSATQQLPPGSALASYEPESGVLTLPSVAVGAKYYDVTMQNTGDYTFVLKTASVAATATGRLEAVARLNSISAREIASAVQAAGGSLPGVIPVYDVTNYRVSYRTLDAQGKQIVASALVSAPLKAAGAMSPVLSYQHGTMFQDAEVPSNHAVASEPAVAFASLGFIVVAPDYVGYGASKGAPHPYLLSAPSASAVIDLLTAAKTWRAQNGVSDNGQLFLSGYSEGGYVTVAAHRALQNAASSHLAGLVAAIPGGGPYNVVLTLDALLDRVQNEVPVLGALITPDLLRLLPTWIRNWLRDELLKRLVPADADVVFDTRIIDNFMRDDDAAIDRESSVHDWAPVAPVRLFHGRDDQTVPYVNATVTLHDMLVRGARDVTLTDCPAVPSSHLGCVPPYVAFVLDQIAARVRDL